jgi:hypothetical protein
MLMLGKTMNIFCIIMDMEHHGSFIRNMLLRLEFPELIHYKARIWK